MGGIGSFFSSYGLLIIVMIAMFAIMIIPQRRRDKKVKAMLAAMMWLFWRWVPTR